MTFLGTSIKVSNGSLSQMDAKDIFLKILYFQGEIFDLVPDAILFSEEKGLLILVKKVNFTGEICVDWKENIKFSLTFLHNT